MSSGVSITLAASDDEVVKAFNSLQRNIDKTAGKLDQMGRKSSKAARQIGNDANAAGKQAVAMGGKLAGAITGIGSAIGLVTETIRAFERERQAIMRREREASLSQLGLGQVIAQTRDNFQGDETLSNAGLEQRIAKASKDSGATQKNVAIALSAKGSATNEEGVQQVVEALRLNPTDPSAAATLAGRAFDLRKQSGVKDPKALIGFLMNIQRSARLTNLEATGANLVPLINALTALGDSPEQAAELAATLTQLTGDETDQVSATGAISLGTALSNFVASKKDGKFASKDKRGEFTIPDAQVAAFEAAKGPTARLGVLQQSDELRRAFLEETSFEKAKGIQTQIKELLSASPEAIDQLRKAQSSILDVSDPRQSSLFEAELQKKRRGRFQPVVDLANETQRNVEAFEAESVKGGRRAAVRESLETVLKKVDLPGFDDDLFGFNGSRENRLRKFDALTTEFTGNLKNVGGRQPVAAGIKVLENVLANDASTSKEKQLIEEQIATLKRIQSSIEATERNTRNGGFNRPAEALSRENR